MKILIALMLTVTFANAQRTSPQQLEVLRQQAVPALSIDAPFPALKARDFGSLDATANPDHEVQ